MDTCSHLHSLGTSAEYVFLFLYEAQFIIFSICHNLRLSTLTSFPYSRKFEEFMNSIKVKNRANFPDFKEIIKKNGLLMLARLHKLRLKAY